MPTQKNSASWDLQLGFNLAFKRLMSPTAQITSSSSHILYVATLNSDCMVSILVLHDAMLSLAPCLLLNTQHV